MVNLGSVHNNFNFLCVSGTLGLEVANTPETAKVKFSSFVCFFLFCRLSCQIVELFFFAVRKVHCSCLYCCFDLLLLFVIF